jgi:4-amino-4-deoxy-L-arabinose transferase-like glycosyltransferase
MADLPQTRSSGFRSRWWLFAVWTAAMGLFTYNSGYGYDALEIAVISQSLADGHRFYDLAPAKPCGVCFSLYALIQCGIPLTHVSLTALTTALAAGSVAAGYSFARRFFGSTEALVSAGLIALATAFMEMNYLVAEGPVVIAGFAAAFLLLRYASSGSWWSALVAGLILGIGFQYKQSAAFYSVGMAIWIFAACRPWSRGVAGTAWFALGHLLIVTAVGGYFAMTGRWQNHLEWTYLFPLREFPASTEYIDRLYTKLVWFTGLMAVTMIAALVRPRVTKEVLAFPATSLLLTAGTLALYPLTKSQAPHYFFPAAAFYAVVIAVFWAKLLDLSARRPLASGRLLALAVVMCVAVLGSVLVYRPEAFSRLSKLADYSSEGLLGHRIQELVPVGDHLIIFREDVLPLYFAARRYPNIPAFNLDVQSEYYYRTRPDALLQALNDSSLVMVLFNPEHPPPFRIDRLSPAERRGFWATFAAALRRQYRQQSDPVLGPNVWLRKRT